MWERPFLSRAVPGDHLTVCRDKGEGQGQSQWLGEGIGGSPKKKEWLGRLDLKGSSVNRSSSWCGFLPVQKGDN